jgi:hypothetical protein
MRPLRLGANPGARTLQLSPSESERVAAPSPRPARPPNESWSPVRARGGGLTQPSTHCRYQGRRRRRSSALVAISEAHRWPFGETLEHALHALEQKLAPKPRS